MDRDDCIFCKIIDRKLPAVMLYEDDKVIAFLDIAPINPGHILVIPKEHHVSASTIPEDVAGRMFKVAARMGIAAKRALESEGYNLHLADGACAGQVVMHAHLHLVPRSSDDGFHWNWRQMQYKDDNQKNEIAEKIKRRFELP